MNWFNKYLKDGEKIIWTGKPNNEFFSSDRNIILSSIAFIVSISFLVIIVIHSSVEYMSKYGFVHGYFWILLFIFSIFILHSVYKILNVTVIRKNAWKNTSYAITDKRILIVIGDKYYAEVIEKNINELTSINISDRSQNYKGVGTIIFGEIPFKPLYIKSSKRENAKKNSQIDGIPVFNNINNVSEVYKLINDLRNEFLY